MPRFSATFSAARTVSSTLWVSGISRIPSAESTRAGTLDTRCAACSRISSFTCMMSISPTAEINACASRS